MQITEPVSETVFVEVVLPFYLPGYYTYRVPQVFEYEIAVGKRVVVQFGKSKIYTGIIIEIHHRVPTLYEAKYIQSIIDEEPLVNAIQLKFWKWMAEYYMCSPGEVMNAALPAGLKLESETKLVLRGDIPIDFDQLNDSEYYIIEALESQKELSVKELSRLLDLKNVYSVIKQLLAKEYIWIKEEIIQTYKPKLKDFIKLGKDYQKDETLNSLVNSLEKKAPKQVDILLHFLHLQQQNGKVEKQILIQKAVSPSSLKTLIDKGVLEVYHEPIDRVKGFDEAELISFELNKEQEQAFDLINQKLYHENYNSCLIHGVTGSGKTHVYVKLIEQILLQGKQVLFMLPEIALTGQMVNRLSKYFGNRIRVSHSKFSENERVEIWNKLAEKKIDIIIGPRSALFLPFQNLGLVIVDEEHESSYKQQDPAPRYHGRDAALVLANYHQAKVVMGSATPSIESYYHTVTGKYALIEMPNRFGGVEMPEMIIADVSEAKKYKTIKRNFTPELVEAIERVLEQGKQAILFQNRRGFIPIHECMDCGWVAKCIHCDVVLTYHKFNDTLRCHYCGYFEKKVSVCKVCGSKDLEQKGFGTEMVAEDIKELFPQARVARMDLETTRSKTGHQKIIQDLEQKRTDVLVGTQMVSKGLDFEDVLLVGIINADHMLHFPDFRANERSFQMMVQVSGRSGRRNVKGTVIIQTSNKEHFILDLILRNDYKGFYQLEILQRQEHLYPPFYRLIKFTIKHKNINQAELAAKEFGQLLKDHLGSFVLGPEKPYLSRLKDYYIWNILIKIEKNGLSANKIKKFLHQKKIEIYMKYSGLIIMVDVDPQ